MLVLSGIYFISHIMKYLILVAFSLFYSLQVFASGNSSSERREELLAYVKKAPKTFSLDALAKYLSHATTNEMEKAEIIFLWLHENIAYDTKSFQKGVYQKQDALTTLKNGKAVCGGYANLYKALGDRMGVKVQIISGYAKGYGYYPRKRFNRTNHAWNIIEIEGKRMAIDPTWGAGYVRKKSGKLKYFKKLDYYWFDTKPSEFVFSHLPKKDTRDQLLESTVSLAEFQELPWVRKSFFKNRIANSDKILKDFKGGVRNSFPTVYDLPIEFAVIKAPLEMKRGGKYLFQFYTIEGEKVGIIRNGNFDYILSKPAGSNIMRFVFTPQKRGKYRFGVKNPETKNGYYAPFMEYIVK